MTISIIIPTLNGDKHLSALFDKIKEQKTSHDIELSIIDSGSKDNTIQIIKKYSKIFKIIFKQIPQSKFNHGLTRNEAIEQSSGEYIVLLTQDALPLNEYWLENLVKPLEDDSQIAGVFGRHLPREDCNPIERRDLVNFFNGFGKKTSVYKLKTKDPIDEYETNKQQLAFFSSNNACIRRSVWKKIPYKKVEILGEDQMWGRDIILAGYKKVYSPHAIVIHSHNYPPLKAFQRWVDDFRFYKQIHNYTGKTSLWKTFLFGCKIAKDNCNYLKNNIEYKHDYKKFKNYSIRIAFSRVFAEYFAGKWEKIPNFLKPYMSMSEKSKRTI